MCIYVCVCVCEQVHGTSRKDGGGHKRGGRDGGGQLALGERVRKQNPFKRLNGASPPYTRHPHTYLSCAMLMSSSTPF